MYNKCVARFMCSFHFEMLSPDVCYSVSARHKKASETRCPVCNKCIVGSPSELILHVDQCLMNVSDMP